MSTVYTGIATNYATTGKVAGSVPQDGDANAAAMVTPTLSSMMDVEQFLVEGVLAAQMKTWFKGTATTLTTAQFLYSGGTGKLALCGNTGIITTSVDGGYTWVVGTTGITTALASMAFSGSTYVCVGASNGATASWLTNSTITGAWTNQVSGNGANNLTAVCFANGAFYGVGAAGTVIKTVNGTTGFTTQAAGAGSLAGVCAGPGSRVVCWESSGTNYYTEENGGTTWTLRTLPGSVGATSQQMIIPALGALWFIDTANKVWKSTDSLAWTQAGTAFFSPNVFAHNGKAFLAIQGANYQWSADGINWRQPVTNSMQLALFSPICLSDISVGSGGQFAFASGANFLFTPYGAYP